jgi:2-(1,2-epoxy-1,2-dihydrophenyl)acetyl-CoA isomerase
MQALDVHLADGVATLTLNRPKAKNALDAEMKLALEQQLASLKADRSLRALILTGAGGDFCAGGDLRGMLAVRDQMDGAGWRQRMRDLHPLLHDLIHFDRPVIAAVDGAAFGAGFSLALAADFVVATPRARFCMSFMRVGLVPDFGAFYTLPRVVGVQRARELMLSAREVVADEALRLGLAMELVAPEALLPRAQALAASFAGASPLATGLIKRALGQSLSSDLDSLLAVEADSQALAFGSDYHAQAVQRFLDKQPASFQWPKA